MRGVPPVVLLGKLQVEAVALTTVRAWRGSVVRMEFTDPRHQFTSYLSRLRLRLDGAYHLRHPVEPVIVIVL